jgi:glycosyltransferase involved in cell wall biosynthesis
MENGLVNTKENVTAVIKAKNEEKQIGEAIVSAFLIANRVLVIDDDSSDSTISVSLEHGAEVVSGPNHSGQIDKLDYFGFIHVPDGWILRMDADERVTEELARELLNVVHSGVYTGARFARLHIMFGAPVYGGGWFRPFQLAFFRADSWDRSWSASLHSQVPVQGAVKVISRELGWSIHHDYQTIEQFVGRSLLKYAKEEARQMFESGRVFKSKDLLVKPFIKILGRYFLRRGFLDGKRGLILAGLLGCYQIMIACFLWQFEEKK